MRAGTTEACLVAREYSEMWQHPIIGLGKWSFLLTTGLYVPTAGFYYTLPGQKYLNKLKFVSQVAHDRDTYATSNISP